MTISKKENLEYEYDKIPTPPEIHNIIWKQTEEALQNTLSYIIDYLKHSCYMFCVKNGKSHFVKLHPLDTAEAYKPFFKEAIDKLKNNRQISEHQREEIRQRFSDLKKKPVRIMQCIVKGIKKDIDDTNEYDTLLKMCNIREDGVYILNLTDAVILRKDGNHPNTNVVGKLSIGDYYSKPFIPIFSISGMRGYADIPIPNYDDVIRVIGSTPYEIPADYYKWEEKTNKAVFRGGTSGCGYTPKTNMRLKAVSLKDPRLDAKIAGKNKSINAGSMKFDKVYGLGMANLRNLQTEPPNEVMLTMKEQSKYKYILHIDGNVAAYRMINTMLTGSLILRVMSEYTFWYEHLIKPNVHYIPIKADLSDLSAQITYAIKNDAKCRQIAKNGYEFAKEVVKREYICGTMHNVFRDTYTKCMENDVLVKKLGTKVMKSYRLSKTVSEKKDKSSKSKTKTKRQINIASKSASRTTSKRKSIKSKSITNKRKSKSK
jgi:hypothetical protein